MDQINWKEFWLKKWQIGQIGFHQAAYEVFLTSHFPKLAPTTIFAPLCGKSKDLLYFAEQGHQVIGVELSQTACESFFTENKIEFKTETQGDFLVFKSKSITLYCGDYFKFQAEQLSGVSCIYDRAALIALPPELRQRYVGHLMQMIRANPRTRFAIFLIALEFPPDYEKGPPFSVSPKEIAALYGGAFEIKELASEREPDLQADEHVYLLTQKSFS